ncbi:hypothetical protein FPOAC2_04394 [Fusarium poae]|uniref:Uncharacterized protein n=1 Tax=Fusarium poae TaxID=36050 RepID=A0A1B8AS82_FUSPO|nr:hypothetical protein FPOAC1_004311 [Fusarium poae]KAG8671074.1 hypothetical protein FPOAC1_004311 [Fusarium poae]OBS23350.1 hypothetical protein FPOA_03899 [Fusarium poae]
MLQISERSVCDKGDIARNLTTEIYPFTRWVQFIHRTAHDFLVDTQAGKDILNYYSGKRTMIDFKIKLFKSDLYLSAIYHTIGVMASAEFAISHCVKLQHEGIEDEVMSQLLQAIQKLWNQGVFIQVIDRSVPSYHLLPARLACELTNMEEFLLPWILKSHSSQDPTIALRHVCLEWNVERMTGPPTHMIKQLISLGADPHAVGVTLPQLAKFTWWNARFTQETSAFELLLRGTLNRLNRGDRDVMPEILQVIDSMTPSCPDYWRRRIIVHIFQEPFGDYAYNELQNWEYLSMGVDWSTFEVNMQYLLKRLLACVESCEIPTKDYKVHEVANSAVKPYIRIRNFRPWRLEDGGKPSCYRVINQESWNSLCDNRFGTIDYADFNLQGVLRSWFPGPEHDFLLGSYERVSIDDEVDEIASEGLGFYRILSQNVDNRFG